MMPERMPRPEGIATNTQASSYRSFRSPERMPRPEGIATNAATTLLLSMIICRNECPDQRGLRHHLNNSSFLPSLAGTNAPTRGDCDFFFHPLFDPLSVPERMPRPEGIATVSFAVSMVVSVWPERMPRPEGIATSLPSPSTAEEKLPERMPRPEGIATYRISVSLVMPRSPERMPRPEGIATHFVGLAHGFLLLPERMPRPEGIATSSLHQGSLHSFAGTNAPTRGDCDQAILVPPVIAVVGRNECPDQRGLRLVESLVNCVY